MQMSAFGGKADIVCAGHLHKGIPMSEINTKFLFTIALEIQVSNLGDTPYGRRRFFYFDGGSFEGPKFKGRVLPGGGGWSLIRRDDVMEVDVAVGPRDRRRQASNLHGVEGTSPWSEGGHGPPLSRRDRRRAYYFRTTPYFETSSEKYGWMNGICSIARGSLSANARTLDVFQVL
jgi:Protein of unknown function (DUF3237)